MPSTGRDVTLSIPAQPGYLVLARLALSAVCRLTSLEPGEVADLKLAVTEAASGYVEEDGDPDATVDFAFTLEDDRIVMEMRGTHAGQPPVEEELGRAIIEATVDEADFGTERTVLVKILGPGGA